METLKFDTVSTNEHVAATIYIGKGDHYLFTCSAGQNADLSSYTASVSDFCGSIATLA